MGKEQLELLERDGLYLSNPEGISMRPMIKSGRDVFRIEKLSHAPKRYDIVMYIRGEDQGVVHRVIRKDPDEYIICGDNCWSLEHVKEDQIKGIVTEFCRKGKWHKTDELGYMIYVHIWTDLLFIRRPVFYIRDKIKRWIRRALK